MNPDDPSTIEQWKAKVSMRPRRAHGFSLRLGALRRGRQQHGSVRDSD
jgi:hypothetical protein